MMAAVWVQWAIDCSNWINFDSANIKYYREVLYV
jgi:hypothetical protein